MHRIMCQAILLHKNRHAVLSVLWNGQSHCPLCWVSRRGEARASQMAHPTQWAAPNPFHYVNIDMVND